MEKIKRLLTLLAITLVLVTASLGILLILDVITGSLAVEAATKLFQVLGIATVASTLIIGVLYLNKK